MTRTPVPTLPSVFDDLHVGVTVHHPETGEILDVNRRLERLYGYSRGELRGMTVEDYTAPSTKYTQAEAVRRIRAAASGSSQEFDWQIERANGELRWVEVRLNATTIGGADCVLAEIHDITKDRARERRLRLLSRIVRHNLRNKMTVVSGHAERLESVVDDDRSSDDIGQIIETAQDVGAMSESVRQIEEIATPDATERTVVDAEAVVRPIVEQMRATHPEADLDLEFGENPEFVVDEGIRYAIEHAIENAIEHNDDECPAVTVTVADDLEANEAVIRIVDDGPRIPPVEIDVLDEVVEKSSTYHGSGVGLWVMQWCVNSLGGSLSFETVDGRGNAVSIALPKDDGERGVAKDGSESMSRSGEAVH